MENRKQLNAIILNFSMIFAIVSILFFAFTPKTMEPSATTSILSFLGLMLFISIPIVAIRTFVKQGGEVSLGKAIKIGLLIGLLGGIATAIYSSLYYIYVNPQAIDQALEISRSILEKHGTYSEEMIEQQMEITRKYFIPFSIFGQIFSGLLYGLIGGLIAGFFFKPKNQIYQ